MGSTTGPSKFKRFINRIFGKRGQKAQKNEPVTTASRQPLSRASRDIPASSTTAPRNQPNSQLPSEKITQNRISDTAPQLTLPNSSEALSPGLLDIQHPLPHRNHDRVENGHTASGISNVVNPRDYRSDTLSTGTTFSSPTPSGAIHHPLPHGNHERAENGPTTSGVSDVVDARDYRSDTLSTSTTFSSPSPPDATGHSSLFPSPLFSATDTTAEEYREVIQDDEVDTFGHQSSPVSSSYSTAPRTPPRDGGLDLTNTTDYDVETTHAPAVTQEIIRPHVHEIIEEHIEREVHVHDVHHYIQPVLDVEFLPAKHYLQDESGNLVPISAEEARHYPEIRQ